MELKGNIKDYTLNRFIEEVGVSKTSMVRYLKNININKFSYFKNVPILFPYRILFKAKFNWIQILSYEN